MTETFIASLRVMGLGMIGIFSVAVVLMLIMMFLTKVFPAKKSGGDEKSQAENTEISETDDGE